MCKFATRGSNFGNSALNVIISNNGVSNDKNDDSYCPTFFFFFLLFD